MRILFLYLYFFWNSALSPVEISENFLLTHYSIKNNSLGLSYEKENQNNQKIQGWIHSGKEIIPGLEFSYRITGISYKRNIQENIPYTEQIYGYHFQSRQIITISPGIKYNFLSIYATTQSINPALSGISLGLNVFPEKSLFLFYKENPRENTKTYALSILSGRTPGIGLAIEKEISQEKVEWSGSVGVSFQFESYQAGTSYYASNQKEENSFFLTKILRENTKALFGKEINPYEDDEKILERESKNKEWEAKKFTKRERIIHEIKIDELLKFRIPLVIAIKIAKASKSKDEYSALLEKMPSAIVKKCNKIQYDKSKVTP